MASATPPDTKQPFRLSTWHKVGVALSLAALLGGGLWGYYRHLHFVWTNDAYLDGYQISLSADIQARLIELFVDEGDWVAEGQLLCQLDESLYLSQKKDAETAVALLQEKVALQQIHLDKLKDIYLVALQEYDNEIISYLDFDKIEKDFRMAEAEYRVAEANLANGIAKLGVIEELLRHTKVYAPRAGAIAKRWVVAGDVVQFGQPLFTLTDTRHIWVTANFEETKVERMQPGNPVQVQIDAYPDRVFKGSVFTVRASAAGRFSLFPPDNATGNFTKVVQRVPVKIWLEIPPSTPPLYLYPGMSAEVDIRIR